MGILRKKQEKEAPPAKNAKAEMFDQEEVIERGGFLCRAIVEVLGNPKEHVRDTMNSLIEKAGKTSGITVISADTNAPVPHEHGFWSTFTEFELLFRDFDTFMGFCFDYMPSSLEILEPDQRRYSSNDLSRMFNDIMGKIHKVDMVAKSLRSQAEVLDTNLGQLMGVIITLALRDGPKTLEEMGKFTRVSPQSLEPFLLSAVKQKKVRLSKGNVYSLPL